MLTLFATINRADADGDPIPAEVAVHFSLDACWPGTPARTLGDPLECWPAEPAEYDLSFVGAELIDACAGNPPLTDTEVACLRAWFDGQYQEAWETAEEAQQ
ncbi:MAG TPA: hypothetical protein VHU42_18455 [Rhodopila sp.]|nr:hypothetical protein [Rhodopila sp.]